MTAPAAPLHELPLFLELRDADRLVGWIDGDVVRFRGFGSERSAARAAAIAHQAMLRRLASASRGTASKLETDLGTVRRATDHADAITNGRSVARVMQSIVDRLSGGDAEFTFEVQVPPPIDELRMRGMAYVMYRALRSSGVAWPLLRPATAPEALAATRTATEGNESTNGITARGFEVIRRLLGRASRPWAFPWARTHRVG